MTEPVAARPFMPDYPVSAGPEGLLSWSWAEQRLSASPHYWVCSVWPDGRPHVMPVWGVWHDGALWFSSGPRSRKARNLRADPRCTVATADAAQPVVLEGSASFVTELRDLQAISQAFAGKYDTEMTVDFLAANATVAVTPTKVVGMVEERFNESPTRWRMPSAPEL